jgi:uncharacterized membrane protein
MWFLGMLVGALIGGMTHSSEGILIGAVLGLLAGIWFGARKKTGAGSGKSVAAVRSDAERIRLLEAQVDWLHRETQSLRGELAVMRGESPEAGGATHAPDLAAMSVDAPRVEPLAVQAAARLSEAAAEPPRHENSLHEKPLAEPAVAEAPTAPSKEIPESPIAIASGLWSRIVAGNPLAKIGVVMLFFGLASALRLAAEYGFLPPSLRLLLGAVAGVAMIAFGFRKVLPDDEGQAPHRTFGLALQGGGFALLYLVVYFMLARYLMIGAGPAFALFAALGVACVLLAARQDGPALAVLGLSGAFVAPVMAGGHSDTPLPLFLYFALLNAFILGVDWFRAWRVLNIAGFILTLAVGMGWALGNYRPEHYAVTQGFLILFLFMYSATPVATALLRAPGADAWREGMLVFGTPIVGGLLQTPLVREFEKGLAWSAFAGALYYFGLWALMFRRGTEPVRLLERSHLGIALALLTITIPLAFDAQVTSAFWAVEGAAVLWFGVHTRRHLAQGTGLAMQLLAGGAFAHGYAGFGHAMPILNDIAIGGLLIALGGLFCGRLLHGLETTAKTSGNPVLPAVLPLGWALLWWFGIGFYEIHYWVAYASQAPAGLLFVVATALLLEMLSLHWRWADCRHAALLLLPALWIAAAMADDRGHHPLAGLMLLALPAAFVCHYWLLARQERTASDDARFVVALRLVRHIGAWWLAILVVALELAWLGKRLAPGVSLWPMLAWGLAPVLGLALAGFALRRELWPWAAAPEAYAGAGALPVALAVALWSLWANLTHAGGGSGLPYLPLLNFFDLVQMGALFVLWRSVGAQSPALAPLLRQIVGGLAFIWLTVLAARIAYHWGGVPFDAHALFHSRMCQAMVTLLWTVLAIGAMIQASRAALRNRWIGGMVLLGVVGGKLLLVDAAGAGTLAWTGTLLGVALLVLAAGYFAPLPPKAAE